MKRIMRILGLTLLIAIIASAGYYTVEIIKARNYTRQVVSHYPRSASCVLKFEDLSDRQLKILLTVEDPAFFTHKGVDLTTPGAGLTTITQSLVKIFYFNNFKPGLAKIKQTLVAFFALDPLVSKEDQLTMFLNYAYLGEGARGFAQAANVYFKKPFSALSEDEYISLVAMVNAPKTFNVRRQPGRNAERSARIKALIEGRYKPKGLCDLYYGQLDEAAQKEVAPMSYFQRYYSD